MTKLPAHWDTLKGECIVANPEVIANGDQVAVPVDHKLCIRRLHDVGVFVVLLDPLHPIRCHSQTISVFKDVLAHLFVGFQWSLLKEGELIRFLGLVENKAVLDLFLGRGIAVTAVINLPASGGRKEFVYDRQQGTHPCQGCCPCARWAETNNPAVINKSFLPPDAGKFMTAVTAMIIPSGGRCRQGGVAAERMLFVGPWWLYWSWWWDGYDDDHDTK